MVANFKPTSSSQTLHSWALSRTLQEIRWTTTELIQSCVSCHPMEARFPIVGPSSLAPSAPGLTVSPYEDDSVARKHSVRCLEGSVEERGLLRSFVKCPETAADPSGIGLSTLPDNVLLSVFRYYVADAGDLRRWPALAGVCQRWRYLMAASADRLNLRLFCTEKAPAAEMIDAWPTLPIVIKNGGDRDPTRQSAGDIIAVLEHRSRVCELSLPHLTSTVWDRVVEFTQDPFPQLTSLELAANDDETTAIVVPESFLAGSAPRLRKVDLANIPFLALPKLLLSATDLVYLRIWDVPNSGFIPPEAIATCLPAMEKLETFHFGFRSPRPPPSPASRRQPPPTRATLPALNQFYFRGNSEYLDDLVAHIDTPLLDDLSVTFFTQLAFYTPELLRLISCTEKFITLDHAEVLFHSDHVKVKFSSSLPRGTVDRESLVLVIRCRGLLCQLLGLAQVLRPPLPPLSTLQQLHISEGQPGQHLHPNSEEETEEEWLGLLQPFTALGDLYLSEELAPRVLPALRELTKDRATKVSPTLQNVFLDGPQPLGPIQDALADFITEQQLSSHPVAVHIKEKGNWVGYMARSQYVKINID